jgi:hypothetical protein
MIVSSASSHWSGRPGVLRRRRWLLGGMPVMVSSLPFVWRTVHDGVMRRSERRRGSSVVGAVEGVVIVTAMSLGVGWKDMVAVWDEVSCIYMWMVFTRDWSWAGVS